MCCDGEDRGRTERPCFPLHCSLVSPRTFKAQPSVRGADLTWGMEEWHLLSWRASRPCFRGRHAVAQPQHTPPDPLSLPPAAAHVGDWCAWLTLWMSRSFSHAPAASSSAPAPGRKRMGFHSASLHLTAPPPRTPPPSCLDCAHPSCCRVPRVTWACAGAETGWGMRTCPTQAGKIVELFACGSALGSCSPLPRFERKWAGRTSGEQECRWGSQMKYRLSTGQVCILDSTVTH